MVSIGDYIAYISVVSLNLLWNIVLFSYNIQLISGTGRRVRPKSMVVSTPTKLLTLEEARERAQSTAPATSGAPILGGALELSPKQKYIEVGGGPQTLPHNFHTVLDLPNK